MGPHASCSDCCIVLCWSYRLYKCAKNMCVFDNLSINREQAQKLEEASRNQHQPKVWLKYRAGRVTASQLKAAVHTDVTQPSRTLIKQICYPESIFVEPSSSVRKLLPQRVRDGHKTRLYYSAPHGECHKGECGTRFVVPEKSAARIIPTLTKIDAMHVFVPLRMANVIFGHVVGG